MIRSADKQKAVGAAQLARAKLGVGLDAPISDVLRVIEDVAEIPVSALPLPDGVAGAYGKQRGRAFIFVNSADHPVRRRFTLAHEYGHHELEHDGVVDRNEDIEGKTKRPEEAEANYFASEFLAPKQAVRTWAEVRQLKVVNLESVVALADYFGISALAARIRFEETNFLSRPRERKALDDAIKRREHLALNKFHGFTGPADSLSGVRLELGARRVPSSEFRRVARAYEFGLASVDKLAAQVGIEPTQMQRELDAAGVDRFQHDDED